MRDINLGVPGEKGFRGTKSKTNHLVCTRVQALKMSSVSILPTPHVHIQLLEWSPWRMRVTHLFLIPSANIWMFPSPLLNLVILLTSAVTRRWLGVTNFPKEDSVPFELTNLRASNLTGLKKLDEVLSSWSLVSVAVLLFLLACFSWSPGKTASSVIFYASHGGLAGSRHIHCKRPAATSGSTWLELNYSSFLLVFSSADWKQES